MKIPDLTLSGGSGLNPALRAPEEVRYDSSYAKDAMNLGAGIASFGKSMGEWAILQQKMDNKKDEEDAHIEGYKLAQEMEKKNQEFMKVPEQLMENLQNWTEKTTAERTKGKSAVYTNKLTELAQSALLSNVKTNLVYIATEKEKNTELAVDSAINSYRLAIQKDPKFYNKGNTDRLFNDIRSISIASSPATIKKRELQAEELSSQTYIGSLVDKGLYNDAISEAERLSEEGVLDASYYAKIRSIIKARNDAEAVEQWVIERELAGDTLEDARKKIDKKNDWSVEQRRSAREQFESRQVDKLNALKMTMQTAYDGGWSKINDGKIRSVKQLKESPEASLLNSPEYASVGGAQHLNQLINYLENQARADRVSRASNDKYSSAELISNLTGNDGYMAVVRKVNDGGQPPDQYKDFLPIKLFERGLITREDYNKLEKLTSKGSTHIGNTSPYRDIVKTIVRDDPKINGKDKSKVETVALAELNSLSAATGFTQFTQNEIDATIRKANNRTSISTILKEVYGDTKGAYTVFKDGKINPALRILSAKNPVAYDRFIRAYSATQAVMNNLNSIGLYKKDSDKETLFAINYLQATINDERKGGQ